MRQKADKLEKGKWYADCKDVCSFLRFSHQSDFTFYYDKAIYVKGGEYQIHNNYYAFSEWDRFLPTPEDIEKYNLNEQE